MKDGGAYVDFQKQLLDYHNNGFVLCLASKNNYSNVKEVFDKHPDMILGEKHFASIKVNWIDKATNIKNMARELNLGLDSFVFIDDNPVEIEEVKSALPSVTSIQFPKDVTQLPIFLDQLHCLFPIENVTKEDSNRTELYKKMKKSSVLSSTKESDITSFLKSLSNFSKIVFVTKSF